MNGYFEWTPLRDGGRFHEVEDINPSFTVHTKRGVMGPVAVGLVAAAVGLSGGAWILSIAGWLAVVTLAVLVQETRHAGER